MSSEQEKREQPQAPVDKPSVWLRLRAHLQQLESQQTDAKDSVALAKRLADRGKVLRQQIQRPQIEAASQTYLAFNKKQERYGIPLNEIAAVELLEHFTTLPNAAGYILGVTPWRGSILSLVDLGRLFGRPESGIADLRVCIVVEVGGRRLAIVAHEMEEIIRVPESELAPPPDLPTEIAPEWIVGVHDENRLILRMSEVMQGIASLQKAGS